MAVKTAKDLNMSLLVGYLSLAAAAVGWSGVVCLSPMAINSNKSAAVGMVHNRSLALGRNNNTCPANFLIIVVRMLSHVISQSVFTANIIETS